MKRLPSLTALLLLGTPLVVPGMSGVWEPGLRAQEEPSGPLRSLPKARSEEVWAERQVMAMGTRLQGRVLAPTRKEGLRSLEEAFGVVSEMEALLSTWRDDTELARLNRSPVGEARAVSPGLLKLLREAREWTRTTGGAFEPRTGALVGAWDLRGEGRRPSADELKRALAASGDGALRLEAARGTATRLHEDAWVDPGGFGKGAALRRVKNHFRSRHVRDAFLDFGGQILTLGGGEGGWKVAVAHPARRHEAAALLRISDRSVATSGASERFVTVRGQALGHVLDPRTGTPVPPWGSVTVVAEDPVAADVLSTALFVLGPEGALRWAREREKYGVLVLEEGPGELRPRWNEAMEAYLIRTPAGTQDPKERRGTERIDEHENHGG